MTEPAENTYPALPVRTDETVFVTFAGFADGAALDRHRAALAGSPQWTEATSAAAVYVDGPAPHVASHADRALAVASLG